MPIGPTARMAVLRFSQRLRFPQRDGLAEHPNAVAKEADFTSFVVVPAHRDFFQAQVRLSRKIKQLDVETETVRLRVFQDRAKHSEPERLESALRIPKWKAGREPDDQIENAPALFALPRLALTDQAPVQGARTESDIDFARGNRLDQLRSFFDRGRQVGIGK